MVSYMVKFVCVCVYMCELKIREKEGQLFLAPTMYQHCIGPYIIEQNRVLFR